MPKAKRDTIKKLQKYPVRRLAVGKAEGRDKEWEGELENLEKKWHRMKKQ